MISDLLHDLVFDHQWRSRARHESAVVALIELRDCFDQRESDRMLDHVLELVCRDLEQHALLSRTAGRKF